MYIFLSVEHMAIEEQLPCRVDLNRLTFHGAVATEIAGWQRPLC